MVLSGKSNVKNLIRSDDSFLVSVFSNVVYVAGPPTWVYFLIWNILIFILEQTHLLGCIFFKIEHIDFHF